MEHYFEKGILPAVTLEDPGLAVKTAEAFIRGGLNVMEVPLRTKAAIDSIRVIRDNHPDLYLGAGTIITTRQVEDAKKAGAQFGLAPGFNREVVNAAKQNELDFIPGIMTPSELEAALEMNCLIQKIFPVSQIGGPDMCKALLGPYQHTGVTFIPMGGITLDNMMQYLKLSNVLAVGGSWLANRKMIAEANYSDIQSNVQTALKKLSTI